MVKRLILLVIGMILTNNALSFCYMLNDANGKIISWENYPPFDISYPPASNEQIASQRRGEHLVIASCATQAEQREENIFDINDGMDSVGSINGKYKGRPLLDQSKPVHVRAYMKQSGIYVREHTRKLPSPR